MVWIAVAALLGGILYGLSGLQLAPVSLLTQNSQLVLYALMFLVGISVGLNKDVLRGIRSYQLRVLVIPAGVVAGSLAGGLVCSLITGLPVNQGTAIASGLGWYSLSGVMLTEMAGAHLGSITFLSNLLREILSFFSIPWVSRHLNFYTCIAPAGATSEDTTLPMMIRYTNEETVVLSVFNGVLCSALVPFLIRACYRFL